MAPEDLNTLGFSEDSKVIAGVDTEEATSELSHPLPSRTPTPRARRRGMSPT